MKEIKIYCNHCGKELDRMKDYIDIQIDANHKWITVDLCEDCFDKLWETIEEFCSK